MTRALAAVKSALKEHVNLSEIRTSNLIASMQPENAAKVYELLGGASSASAEIVRTTAGVANGLRNRLRTAAAEVEGAIQTCESRVKENDERLADAEALGKALQVYLATANDFVSQVAQLEPSLAGPTESFRQAVDALAGTSEISLLIALLEKRPTIERAMRIGDVLEGLKELKKHVEQTLAETTEASMSTDLTTAVMKRYGKIRTDGDPDVHLSGFAMDRTRTGDFKSRRLSVKARSYGVELASAVSSLSESQLNALGLCLSIASAIRSPGPWDFPIIDEANRPDSVIRLTQVILDPATDLQKTRTVVVQSNLAQQIGIGAQTTGATPSGATASATIFAAEAERKVAQAARRGSNIRNTFLIL